MSGHTEFDQTSLKEHGRVLTGRFAHFCWDWDGMTVDETTEEWKCCTCFVPSQMNHPPLKDIERPD